MLNLSNNSIKDKVDTNKYQSFLILKNYSPGKIFKRICIIMFCIFLGIIFLPWTQTVIAKGYITTLKPGQRPQTVNSIIAGRIEAWFVKEGDYVNKGDTIMFISEIKDQYFDPKLLDRTEAQIKSKELTVQSYMDKVKSLDNQADALLKTKRLKIEQAKNYIIQSKLKIKSDSIDLVAAKTNYSIAKKQFERMEELYKDGLKSLTDLEARKLKLQETESKMINAENKLISSKNELINAKVELSSIENQYADKLAKTEAEKYAALSSMYDAEAIVTKMQNEYMNYSVRKGMYYLTAPQNGYITKVLKTGIGETIKEGEEILSIMPFDYQLAVEMYVKPADLPLIKKGQSVRFLFDGWPSVAFSGWPNLSFGTFGGKVLATDNFISDNGKFRVLVIPDKNDVPWPSALRVGSGAKAMALLNDVPIWYEIWRRFNGFPPDYYNTNEPAVANTKNK